MTFAQKKLKFIYIVYNFRKIISEFVSRGHLDVIIQREEKNLKNIFDEGELQKEAVVKKFLTTANDGKKYNVLHYNLDAIIAVGYRINLKKQQNLEYGQQKF